MVVTLSRANEYYMRIKKIIDRVADLVIPKGEEQSTRR